MLGCGDLRFSVLGLGLFKSKVVDFIGPIEFEVVGLVCNGWWALGFMVWQLRYLAAF